MKLIPAVVRCTLKYRIALICDQSTWKSAFGKSTTFVRRQIYFISLWKLPYILTLKALGGGVFSTPPPMRFLADNFWSRELFYPKFKFTSWVMWHGHIWRAGIIKMPKFDINAHNFWHSGSNSIKSTVIRLFEDAHFLGLTVETSEEIWS